MKSKLAVVCLGLAVALMLVMPASAVQPVTTTATLTLSDPCNGDTATGTVTVSTQTSLTFSSDGSIAHVKMTEDIHGTLTGLTGITYQINAHVDLGSGNIDIDPTTETGEETISTRLTVSAQGGNGNLTAVMSEHITVNANGTVTVDKIVPTTINCQ